MPEYIMPDYEYVKHPSHYNTEDTKECWDLWVDNYGLESAIIICLGNVDKYLYRAGMKLNNTELQDMRKAYAYYAKATELLNSGTDLHYSDTVQSMYKQLSFRLSQKLIAMLDRE